ncbi:hypothetical protein Tco_1558856, partial [Tanacetum coccineum]
LQSMSPRAFMRKHAKAHVDTPTSARQLMYSSTHGTCDIEARDINNSCKATLVPNGIEESSSNNPSKQKACQQSVEPTVKRKGSKDAIKALTSNVLQSMSPRAYSSTHGTYDIEDRDINNSCNATPVPVLHTSLGVNTSPSDDTWDKNRGIFDLRTLLMNRVPRWGQVSSPASFIKHGKEESSSNNPRKQKACQQRVEPTVKRKGAKVTIKALTSKVVFMYHVYT